MSATIVRVLTSGSVTRFNAGVRYTNAPQRREELMRRLLDSGYVSSAQLAGTLGVSEMTIRRDLRRLEEDGYAQRVLGGASLPGSVLPSSSFDQRDADRAEVKQAMAAAALPLLVDADGGRPVRSVALDAGTTVAALAERLPAGLTIVTHSLPVLSGCAERTDLELIGLGGGYQQATRSFAGPATRAALEQMAVDVAVLSATAYGRGGLYSANPLDAEIKQAMMRIARRVVLLVDRTKLEASAPIRFGGLAQVDVVITDEPPVWLNQQMIVVGESVS